MPKITNWYIYGRQKGSFDPVHYLGYVKASTEEKARKLANKGKPNHQITSVTKNKR